MEWSDDDRADEGAPEGKPLPMKVVAAGSGKVLGEIAARCRVQVLRGGDLLAAGLANCRQKVAEDRAVQRYEAARGQWQPVPGLQLPRGGRVRALAAAPRGDRYAVAVADREEDVTLLVMDLASGAELARKKMGGSDFSMMRFLADGQRLVVAAGSLPLGRGSFLKAGIASASWA